MGMILSLLLTASVLRIVGGLTSSLEVKGWGAAFIAAIVLLVLGILAESGLEALLPSPALWQMAVCRLAFNTVTVALVALFLPGITLRGVLGLFVAGVLLTALQFVSPFIARALMNSGVLS
jgi:uncharacterized membrane protein YvlD (DUF360 family)